MADEEIQRIEPEHVIEQRSAWQITQQAADVYGTVTAGTGALAGGLAAAKLAFGSKHQATEQQSKKD